MWSLYYYDNLYLLLFLLPVSLFSQCLVLAHAMSIISVISMISSHLSLSLALSPSLSSQHRHPASTVQPAR